MTDPASTPVYLLAESASLEAQADALADRYGLPRQAVDHASHYLLLTEQRLELHALDDRDSGPVTVDWVAGAVAHRRRFGGGRGQPIARAAGLKAGVTPSVLDATAGLGRDAFVLASLGCPVTLVERSPVVAALLEDGYTRACHDAEIGAWVAERMTVVQADAIAYLRGINESEQPDVVYLDPMYPGRQKSSLVKKEMRALQSILGKDPDVDALLPTALAAARCRVVVKRPMQAEPLADRTPTMAIKGKKHRYDVYVKKAMRND